MASICVPTNPFDNAAAYLGVGSGLPSVTEFVQDQIDYAETIINESLSTAYNTIAGIEGIQLIIPDSIVPVLEPLDFEFIYEFSTDPLDATIFGTIPDYNLGTAPEYTGRTTISVPPIPAFDPSYTSFNIPPAPTFVLPPDPGDAPIVEDPVFPPAPILVDPVVPGLSTIVLPDAPDIIIPEFTGTFPTFDALPPNIGFNWTEPVYTTTILDQTVAQIEVFLAGGTGIRSDVQDLMYNQAAEREDRIAMQSVQEVTDEYAARGYILPPGLLQKRINAIRIDRNLKKQGLNREVLIKTMEAEIENLRFAVQQGAVAEELYIRLFLASVERTFMAQRLGIEFAMQLYSLLKDIFLAKQEEVKTRALVYETQVRAALIQIEIYKAQIEGELAKVQLDQAKVELYNAQVTAMKTFVEKYEVEIRAEVGKLEAIRIQVQAFSETINAYVARIQAQKIQFDAFDSEVRGELGKGQLVESQARAYAAEIEGIGVGVSAQSEAIKGEVGVYVAKIQGFATQSESLRDRANVQLGSIQANVAGYEADTQRYGVDSSRQEAIARIELAAWNAGLEGQLGYYRAQLGKYDIDARLLTEQARIALGGLEASGGLATTIVGGALAAMHVGASISGSGTISASGTLSDSYQTSNSTSLSTQVSQEISQSIRYNIDADGGNSEVATAPPWGLNEV